MPKFESGTCRERERELGMLTMRSFNFWISHKYFITWLFEIFYFVFRFISDLSWDANVRLYVGCREAFRNLIITIFCGHRRTNQSLWSIGVQTCSIIGRVPRTIIREKLSKLSHLSWIRREQKAAVILPRRVDKTPSSVSVENSFMYLRGFWECRPRKI